MDPNSTCLLSVRQMRDQVRADVVSLWVEGQLQTGQFGAVGIAYVINRSFAPGGVFQGEFFAPYAYSVLAQQYATNPAFTFTHEVGHNLGANHDRITDAAQINDALFPFAFDYIAPGNAFRTVMAYEDKCGQCPIILNFSNPNVTRNGVPTGSASEDNHQTLINTINAVINFRQCNLVPCNTSVTPTATPVTGATATPTATCSPRPNVQVNAVRVGNNLLQVTVTAGGTARLQQLQFGAATNALIDVPAGGLTGISGNRNVALPANAVTTQFTVRHATTSQATTVPLTVVDSCGNWPTFVGGGASAF